MRNYFLGDVTSKTLKDVLENEIREYGAQLMKKGGSVPINLVEDIVLSFGEKELFTLGNSFLNHDLTVLEMGYIADALLLSNQVLFKSESVREALEGLTDPEINGAITQDRVRSILSQF